MINMDFYMLFFPMATRFLNLDVKLKVWLLTSSKSYREKFFHTNKCEYMPLINGNELHICEGNRYISPCSATNRDLF